MQAARDIASTISGASNRVFLSSDSLLLNLVSLAERVSLLGEGVCLLRCAIGASVGRRSPRHGQATAWHVRLKLVLHALLSY